MATRGQRQGFESRLGGNDGYPTQRVVWQVRPSDLPIVAQGPLHSAEKVARYWGASRHDERGGKHERIPAAQASPCLSPATSRWEMVGHATSSRL